MEFVKGRPKGTNPAIMGNPIDMYAANGILVYTSSLSTSAIMCTLTAHCQWEDEMARERTGHPPSYAEAKKIKLHKLYTHGCLMFYIERLLFISSLGIR